MASSRNFSTEMVFNFGAKMLSLLRPVPFFCLSFVGLNVKTAPVMSVPICLVSQTIITHISFCVLHFRASLRCSPACDSPGELFYLQQDQS